MLTFEQAQEILTKFADQLPDEIYDNLNGGIVLVPDTIISPEGASLYIMGQYHVQPGGLGRYITIHYGSFMAVYGTLSEDRQKDKLKEILYHELTHHLEHKAGDRSLEIEDAKNIAKYKKLQP